MLHSPPVPDGFAAETVFDIGKGLIQLLLPLLSFIFILKKINLTAAGPEVLHSNADQTNLPPRE